MGIKEKELEDLVLNLLDTSSAIQRKIRNICLPTQYSTIESNQNEGKSNDQKPGLFEKKRISSWEATIEQLKNQLAQSQSAYKQVVSKMQEYKNYSAQLQSKCSNLESEKNNLENTLTRLEHDLKKAKIEMDEGKKRLKEHERENARLKESEQSLSSSLTKATDNIRILKERFYNPVNLLERYRSLSVSIRTGLSDVICDKDEILFIASCSTPDHLKAIWTYTKRLAGSNGDVNEVKILIDIFDYFFDVFNGSLREPMYVRDNVEIGYSFDDDKYDRCTGSSTSGKIKEVILRGYKSVNTGTIICRSFVRV